MNFTKRFAVIALGIGLLSIGGMKLYHQFAVADSSWTFGFLHKITPANFGERDYKTMLTMRETVQEGEILDVNVPMADVKILTTDSQEARIEVQMAAKDWEKAKAFYESLNFSAHYVNGKVVVKTNRENGRWDNYRTGQAQFRVIAHIPELFHVEVETSAGDVELGNLKGDATLRSSAGDLSAKNIMGHQITLRTSAGDIETEDLKGKIDIFTSAGDIKMGSLFADGLLKVHTSAGDIEMQNVEANEIEMKSSAGDIHIEELTGDTNLRTSAGNIEIAKLYGALEAKTSAGDIAIDLVENHEVNLETSVGSIEIAIPADFRANLDLEGSEVNMKFNGAFEGTKREKSVQGKINGGGASIYARSQMGSIRLK